MKEARPTSLTMWGMVMKDAGCLGLVAVYLAAMALTFGMTLAFDEAEMSSLSCRSHLGHATLNALIPQPVALPLMFLLTGFAEHGIYFSCRRLR